MTKRNILYNIGLLSLAQSPLDPHNRGSSACLVLSKVSYYNPDAFQPLTTAAFGGGAGVVCSPLLPPELFLVKEKWRVTNVPRDDVRRYTKSWRSSSQREHVTISRTAARK